jgi:hypothetical protein
VTVFLSIFGLQRVPVIILVFLIALGVRRLRCTLAHAALHAAQQRN